MTIANGKNDAPIATRTGGKTKGIVVCWFLGLGSLVSWNSMLTIGDYYYTLFPKYHPSRVLTLVYQPFALGTMAILAYKEAKINTRKRNIAGYILFTASTLMLIVVDLATSGRGGIGPFVGICAVVAAFGIADAHVQGGMVGDMAFMCPEFMQVTLLGILFQLFFHSKKHGTLHLTAPWMSFPAIFLCWAGCIRSSDLWSEIDH